MRVFIETASLTAIPAQAVIMTNTIHTGEMGQRQAG
jgi:hypothetical protein